MSQAIIFGSSRSFGKTRAVIDDLLSPSKINLFDLNSYKISPFDYDHANRHDDFMPLIERLLHYDTWIIATPVYWYNMSTQHKIFFDRFSDLLTIRKDLGRQLRGKKLFVIASFGDSYPQGFEDTFKQICDYLGMAYLGSSFFYSGSVNQEYLTNNAAQARLVSERLSINTP
ncbi:MAG: FMN reductase [Candidatus Puniceispirillum sp.]|nr:FMN reductase [Candidatus Puniceispirillum sp.]